jgi:hypothetical protein
MTDTLPMHLVDLEMAAQVKAIARKTHANPEVAREVMSTVAEYLTHRSQGDDDSARHDLKYVTMVVEVMS